MFSSVQIWSVTVIGWLDWPQGGPTDHQLTNHNHTSPLRTLLSTRTSSLPYSLLFSSQTFTPLQSSILQSDLTRCKWSPAIFLFFRLWAEVNRNLWVEENLNGVQHLSYFYFQLEKFSQVTEMISIGWWGPVPSHHYQASYGRYTAWSPWPLKL